MPERELGEAEASAELLIQIAKFHPNVSSNWQPGFPSQPGEPLFLLLLPTGVAGTVVAAEVKFTLYESRIGHDR